MKKNNLLSTQIYFRKYTLANNNNNNNNIKFLIAQRIQIHLFKKEYLHNLCNRNKILINLSHINCEQSS